MLSFMLCFFIFFKLPSEHPEYNLEDKPKDEITTINVDFSKVSSEISPYIYGSSWADWIDELPPALDYAKLNIPIIKMGGNNFSIFDLSTELFYHDSGKRQLENDLGEYMRWFANNGTQTLLQINMLGVGIDTATNERVQISSPQAVVDFLIKTEQEYGIRIKYISMDNEPFIWSETHSELHPDKTTYDEYLNKFIEYASAIKEYDNEIVIMGPENCNPYFYYHSSAIQDTLNGNWIEYFLKKCKEYEEKNNLRLLDVLTVHRYPVFRDFDSEEITATNQQILDSTQGWYDKDYDDGIDPTAFGGNGTIVKLKEWVDKNYPGTKIGITEYNLDFNSHVGYDPLIRAVWLADTLGAFAKYGVDYAIYWNVQEENGHGLIYSDKFKEVRSEAVEKRLSYYSFYLMSNYLQGSLVEAVSGNGFIKVYGAINGNSKNLIVINTDDINDYHCKIDSNIGSFDESYNFKSKSVTVFEINNDNVYIHTLDSVKSQF